MKLHLGDVGKIWIRVRNRPTKRLEPAYKASWTDTPTKVFKKWLMCMPGSASPHSAARPRPPKKVVFWRQSTNFPLLHPGNGHISKTRTKTQLVSFWTDMVKKVLLKVLSKPILNSKLLYLKWNTQFSIFKKTDFEPIHFEPGVFCFYLELKIEPYFPKWCYTNKNTEHNNSKMSLFWNILAKTCLYRILYRPIWTCLSRYGPQSPGLLSADMSRYGPVSFWIPMVLDTNGFIFLIGTVFDMTCKNKIWR